MLRIQLGELFREERLLVLADASLDVGVYNSLQSHCERVQVPLVIQGMDGDELPQFVLYVTHRLAGELYGRDLFRLAVDHLEPAEDSRQGAGDFHDHSLDPESLESPMKI